MNSLGFSFKDARFIPGTEKKSDSFRCWRSGLIGSDEKQTIKCLLAVKTIYLHLWIINVCYVQMVFGFNYLRRFSQFWKGVKAEHQIGDSAPFAEPHAEFIKSDWLPSAREPTHTSTCLDSKCEKLQQKESFTLLTFLLLTNLFSNHSICKVFLLEFVKNVSQDICQWQQFMINWKLTTSKLKVAEWGRAAGVYWLYCCSLHWWPV